MEPIAQNLLKLLEPGGAIQWEECNWMETQYYRSSINSSVQAVRYICARFKEGMKDKSSYGWKILPRIYDEFGMGDVVETRAAMARNAMDAIFGWARLVSSRNLSDSLPAEELVRLEREVERDIASGHM
ncbi:hypothetical protein BCON_0052g00030 [Botryotinia convoluta]|uniref:Uncharacterized protein n=1 Tax=Botryotinia convoluta TaxID=54673 RepID=A0A4Z1IAL2_9HELO|nr:hypothetical protein BCON_0052g00030 [Botryotinia convoluta]